jgi:hypothetical protein
MPQARTLGWILLGLVSGVIITVVTLIVLLDGLKESVADFLETPAEMIVEKEVLAENLLDTVVTVTSGVTPASTESGLTQALQQAPLRLGPLLVEGIYCWRRDSDETEQLRFSIYNPTDEAIEVMVPHGRLIARPGEVTTSGYLTLGGEAECVYDFALRQGIGLHATSTTMVATTTMSSTTILTTSAWSRFEGVRLNAPRGESQELVGRFLNYMEAGDLDAVELFVEPATNVDLVALIAWRAYITPVRVEVGECLPHFTVGDAKLIGEAETAATSSPAIAQNASRRPFFTAESYVCDVDITHATFVQSPGSGVWPIKVRQDLSDQSTLIIPTKPSGF